MPFQLDQLDHGGPLTYELLHRSIETSSRRQRWVKLPLSWTSNRHSKEKLLIKPSRYLSLADSHKVEIEMMFPRKPKVERGAWRVLAAYPRLQWSETILTLPNDPTACGGIAVNSTAHETIFIILRRGLHGT